MTRQRERNAAALRWGDDPPTWHLLRAPCGGYRQTFYHYQNQHSVCKPLNIKVSPRRDCSLQIGNSYVNSDMVLTILTTDTSLEGTHSEPVLKQPQQTAFCYHLTNQDELKEMIAHKLRL